MSNFHNTPNKSPFEAQEGAGFVQRPWPQRPPEASPFRHFRALVLGSSPGRNLAIELTAAGLPTEYPSSENHPGPGQDDGHWDLVIGTPNWQEFADCMPSSSTCVRVLLVPDTELDPEGSDHAGFGRPSPLADDPDLPRWDQKLDERASAARILQCFGQEKERRALVRENESLKEQLALANPLREFPSSDEGMQEILRTAQAVANTRATVLLLGESGTGKSRLARALHEHSDRSQAPFQVVHCGALPGSLLESELFGHAKGAFTGAHRDRPGRFEEADGGTLFLDEIQSAPLDLQVKLLRVLQDRMFERVGETRTREVDVRIIAASNQDLEKAIRDGEFREDLFWRLNVVSLTLPPLRSRLGDFAPLVDGFLRRFGLQYDKPDARIETAVLAGMVTYAWPGNIRQLENVIERAVLLSGKDPIGWQHLPKELSDSCGPGQDQAIAPDSLMAGLHHLALVLPLKEALLGPEKAILVHALESTGGNRSEAAKKLGINRTTLFNKMRKHGLMDRQFAGPANDHRPGPSAAGT